MNDDTLATIGLVVAVAGGVYLVTVGVIALCYEISKRAWKRRQCLRRSSYYGTSIALVEIDMAAEQAWQAWRPESVEEGE